MVAPNVSGRWMCKAAAQGQGTWRHPHTGTVTKRSSPTSCSAEMSSQYRLGSECLMENGLQVRCAETFDLHAYTLSRAGPSACRMDRNLACATRESVNGQ